MPWEGSKRVMSAGKAPSSFHDVDHDGDGRKDIERLQVEFSYDEVLRVSDQQALSSCSTVILA